MSTYLFKAGLTPHTVRALFVDRTAARALENLRPSPLLSCDPDVDRCLEGASTRVEGITPTIMYICVYLYTYIHIYL